MNKKINKEVDIKKVELLPLTSDYVFKRVFAFEGNESALKDFLEAILNIKIDKIEVQNPELIKTYKEEKSGLLDIKVHVNDNSVIDVEMQVRNEHNLHERMTTYAGKLISIQLKRADDYKKLKKTIIIFITNFNCIKRNSYHNIARMKYDKTTEDAYVDMGYEQEEENVADYIETHVIELPKFKKKNPDVKTKLDQWLWLITGEGEKVKMAEKENKEVKKAADILNKMSLDPKELEIYFDILQAEFNDKISKTNFFEEGKAEGRKQERIEMAKKLLAKNVAIKEIIEITELNEEEIKQLKKE